MFSRKWYIEKNTENSSRKIIFQKKILLKSDYTQPFYFPYAQRAEHTPGATLEGKKKKNIVTHSTSFQILSNLKRLIS